MTFKSYENDFKIILKEFQIVFKSDLIVLKSFVRVFKSLDVPKIVFRHKRIKNASKTMAERPGTHLERCALKNWCGK